MVELTQIIADLGFPIAVCVALFYHNEKQQQRHQEEIKELTKAIDNNTEVMRKLVEKNE